jgi:hypothetical protein
MALAISLSEFGSTFACFPITLAMIHQAKLLLAAVAAPSWPGRSIRQLSVKEISLYR